jgi:CRISPR/Cas system CMR-associated protein Cmr5 small subunit
MLLTGKLCHGCHVQSTTGKQSNSVSEETAYASLAQRIPTNVQRGNRNGMFLVTLALFLSTTEVEFDPTV